MSNIHPSVFKILFFFYCGLIRYLEEEEYMSFLLWNIVNLLIVNKITNVVLKTIVTLYCIVST